MKLFLLFMLSSLGLWAQPSHGSQPYVQCYGTNIGCSGEYCSIISVKPPRDYDVIVTIKQGGENGPVVAHGYLRQGYPAHKFDLPNGTYQAFFYYGKEWKAQALMPSKKCRMNLGNFSKDVTVGKDYPEYLYNAHLSYELIVQPNGNFQTKGSNLTEAF